MRWLPDRTALFFCPCTKKESRYQAGDAVPAGGGFMKRSYAAILSIASMPGLNLEELQLRFVH